MAKKKIENDKKVARALIEGKITGEDIQLAAERVGDVSDIVNSVLRAVGSSEMLSANAGQGVFEKYLEIVNAAVKHGKHSLMVVETIETASREKGGVRAAVHKMRLKICDQESPIDRVGSAIEGIGGRIIVPIVRVPVTIGSESARRLNEAYGVLDLPSQFEPGFKNAVARLDDSAIDVQRHLNEIAKRLGLSYEDAEMSAKEYEATQKTTAKAQGEFDAALGGSVAFISAEKPTLATAQYLMSSDALSDQRNSTGLRSKLANSSRELGDGLNMLAGMRATSDARLVMTIAVAKEYLSLCGALRTLDGASLSLITSWHLMLAELHSQALGEGGMVLLEECNKLRTAMAKLQLPAAASS